MPENDQQKKPGTDAWSMPLEDIDVSQPQLYSNDTQGPYFARLRQQDPVHFCKHSANGAYWSITRMEDIKFVDSNHQLFSSQKGGIGLIDSREDEPVQQGGFIELDPPAHGKQRGAVAPAVAPRNLANLEPLIRERVIGILESLPVSESFDWVNRVSIELTTSMLATLFDFPHEDRRKLAFWSDVFTSSEGTMGEAAMSPEQRHEETAKFASTFVELFQQRLAGEPGHDLISMLAHGETSEDLQNDPLQLLGTLVLLTVGGNDTTRNSISGGVLALNQYPDQYELLRQRPELIPNMVSEMIRWQSPVIHMRRTATEDVELGGKTIRSGDKVVMWYLSGNRDEDVFEAPERLMIDRPKARQHASFGYGIHRCMGNRLAEMQLRVLWEEIQQRFARVEVVGEVQRVQNNFIRGISELPVRLHAL